jgi:hypothetical protein
VWKAEKGEVRDVGKFMLLVVSFATGIVVSRGQTAGIDDRAFTPSEFWSRIRVSHVVPGASASYYHRNEDHGDCAFQPSIIVDEQTGTVLLLGTAGCLEPRSLCGDGLQIQVGNKNYRLTWFADVEPMKKRLADGRCVWGNTLSYGLPVASSEPYRTIGAAMRAVAEAPADLAVRLEFLDGTDDYFYILSAGEKAAWRDMLYLFDHFDQLSQTALREDSVFTSQLADSGRVPRELEGVRLGTDIDNLAMGLGWRELSDPEKALFHGVGEASLTEDARWREMGEPEKNVFRTLSDDERLFARDDEDRSVVCGAYMGHVYKIALLVGSELEGCYVRAYRRFYGEPARPKLDWYKWGDENTTLELQAAGPQLNIMLTDRSVIRSALEQK